MRMSIALPIAAALAAAIGVLSLAPAQAKGKTTINSCNDGRYACLGNCNQYSDGEFKRGCLSRCNVGWNQCLRAAATGSKIGGGDVKPGGGASSGSTAGGQPTPKGPILAPKGPVLGGSTGANGGGKPVVKPIGNASGPFGGGAVGQYTQSKTVGSRR
jgi:hypothetical protein